MSLSKPRFRGLLWLSALTVAGTGWGQTVYTANFQSGVPAEFAASGALSGLGTISLPTDGGGMSSANNSMWLGPVGQGIAKNANVSGEVVTLTISGVTPGTTYSVAFDLLIGASWDGAANSYGPDEWRLKVDGTTLVDTIFSDSNGSNLGAYSPQRYSDATFTNPNGPDQPYFSGADFYSISGIASYANDYAIYYFSHGAGNPYLTFTASSSTAVLEFARLPTASADSSDEYWALDNVAISAIPEPAQCGAILAGVASVGAVIWRRRSGRHATHPPQ